MEEKILPPKNQKIIELMNHIARKSEGKGIEEASKIKEVSKLKEFLNCSSTQALLFSLIIYLTVTDDQLRFHDIAKHLKHDPVDMLHRISDLRVLQKKGLIRKCRTYRSEGISDVNFYVPSEIIEALSEENRKILNPTVISDAASLFSRINKLTDYVEEEIINQDELEEEILELLDNNPTHYTVKNLSKYKLSEWDKLLLLTVGAEFIKGIAEIDLNELLKTILMDAADRFRIKRKLIKGEHPLIRKELIRLEYSYFRTDRNVFLTDKAVRELFDMNYDDELKSTMNDKDIILPERIGSRSLYFNKREADQLAQIHGSLSRKSYNKIIRELQRNNMPAGITILFHGVPGTGKTEGVYQLARRLKKMVLMVDISSMKNFFFGESEKEVKRLFEKYRKLVDKEANCPILLFNEADGVLGKRKNVNSSSVAQTENAMQNIILQEMENLHGIMIATTNLTMNLDKAFERRFLYKVKFEGPDAEIGAKIWKEHILDLKISDARKLSEKFNYTGGQISNIARKVISGKIINQQEITLSEIFRYCEEETLKEEDRRVGY